MAPPLLCDNRRVRGLLFGDVVFYLGVYAYCLWRHQPGWRYVAGMSIATAGYALWFTARAQLGKSFTVRAVAQDLVTTGLYSKFRHPIYLFSTVGMFGLCLAMHWYKFGAVYITLVAATQWWRARAEAAVLEARFGDAYRRYRAGTWF